MDIETHMSLVKLRSGRFLVIDAVPISSSLKTQIDELTNGGSLIEACVMTHPFHTVYVQPFHALYPTLRYYGTPRHLRNIPIKWEGSLHEPEVRSLWENEGVFMRIPDGAEFEYPVESNHFSSVFVFHQDSRTIHVDDTIQYFENPGWVLSLLGKKAGRMEFWYLDRGLHHTQQGPLDFKAWVEQLLQDWDFDNLCTAHVGNRLGGAKELLRTTLEANTPTLMQLSERWTGNVEDTSVVPLSDRI